MTPEQQREREQDWERLDSMLQQVMTGLRIVEDELVRLKEKWPHPPEQHWAETAQVFTTDINKPEILRNDDDGEAT